MVDVEKLKQKILDLAIRGKLVPQDPNDEPASVLIEKIKAEKAKLIKEGKIKAFKEESYIYKGSDNFYYEKTPNNWSIVSLGELISLKSGVDLKLNEINTNQTGIPYLTGASCFNNGNLDIIRWTKFPTNITHKGDLLITVKGTIGEMAFNNIGDAHIARQIMSISISPYINPFYVFYVLEARKNELIQKSSSLIPGITRDNVLLFQIAVPPRNEQDKIVEALKTSLDKIQVIKENIEEISNISALIKSQILSSVFAERSSYKSYYEKPKLNTLCRLSNGDYSEGQELPYLEAKVIRGSKQPKVVKSGIKISKGTTIILVDGENSGEVMTAPFDGYMGSTFRILEINASKITKDYLLLFLLLNKQRFKDNKKGSAIPHLNKKLFNELTIILPDKVKQKMIVEYASKVFANLDNIID